MHRRALIALWVICVGVVAVVWLRPLHPGALPAPAPLPVARATTPIVTSLAGDDELGAADNTGGSDEPGALVRTGVPERLNRQDLEGAMDKLRPKVLACQKIEQFNGLMQVKLIVTKGGSLQSVQVSKPADQTRTAECVRHALHGLSLPRFRGNSNVTNLEWLYTFFFKS